MYINVLTATFIGGSIAGILGIVLMMADRFIANYGKCKININGQKEIEIDGGNTLLASLQGQNIFIPSSCGSKGSCGLCKVKVIEGGGDILPTESAILSKREMQSNIRLACQIKVRDDIQIELPDWILNLKPRIAQVGEILDLNYDTKLIRLSVADEEAMEFTPGQYIQIKVPQTDQYRAYSIASRPGDKFLDLIIRQVPGGVCTTYVHEQLKTGEDLEFLGPCGDFKFNTASQKEVILIAGGSGLAPMRSILQTVFAQRVERKFTLFFGAVTKSDLYIIDEIEGWKKTHDNFKFIPALSNPAHHDIWNGEKGLITEVVERHIKDAINKEVYLCGSPAMIDAALAVLKKIGFSDDDIHCDRFA